MYRNANNENEAEDRRKSSSSSEGEYQVGPEFQTPNFSGIPDWNPQGPASLQYMCLFPMLRVRFNCSFPAEQSPHVNKVKVSITHRQQRLKEFKSGKTTGRNIHDEKRLHKAASDNQYDVVVELLESGVDPCCCDNKQRSALHFAASQGNELIVKALLDKGANPNSRDILGNTPMHLAAITGHVPVVTLLLKAGTDIKSMDKNGRTPLHLAQARLKVLSTNTSCSSEHLKAEVTQISEMMKTYLNLSDLNVTTAEVDQLCNQLEQSSTLEEVDAVNSLLASFTSMTIQKDQQPG
ncbi:ankyrin repeat domain-containing protein 54-like [Babylonia areolata]|uniref:ankyrin repeat domain-containing protein 54-like n=1 Tax=Babylonia areolata TaxID=304850 RepID=UPI003FD61D40